MEASGSRVGSGTDNGGKESNRWTTLKSGLVLGLKATEIALDGLPIPGAKGCVTLILQVLKTVDLTVSNAEALEALQNRLDGLREVLLPVYSSPSFDIPDDVRKTVANLAGTFDKLAAKWKPKLEKKHRKRDFIRRMFNSEDDQANLTMFANAVEQAIQDFLVITVTNGRIAAFREDLKEREARALDRLPRASAAPYNCIRTGGADVCLKGTRISILNIIRVWAKNPDPNQPPMFWLNGLAGIGKSTIAHTIASELDAEGLLGASFIFLRAVDELKDARLVFPTLALQLAQYNSRFKTGLGQVLEQDPNCASNLLDLQFKKLILRPFSALSLSAPVIIVLDALDECDPERLTSDLLRILLKNIRSAPFLRVFITSRPEGYIREALDLVDSTSPHQKLVLHEDIHAESVESDIRLFLQTRLQEIWNERTNQTSVRWPPERDLVKLVQQSGKLFVYAATAVRFIGGNRELNLKRQMSRILSVKIGHIPQGEPYRQLDGLYLQILDSVLADSSDEYYVHRFRKIVGSVVLLERPLPLGSFAKLLGEYSVEEIKETLYHLHSIMIVPAAISEAPRCYHLSFPNFITNSNRCTNQKAYIDPGLQAKYLFLCCLTVVERDFGPILVDSPEDSGSTVLALPDKPGNQPQNVIPLQDSDDTVANVVHSAEDSDPDDSRSGLSHTLSSEEEANLQDYSLEPEIRYSDNYWCRHLMNVPTSDQEAALALQSFIMHYFPKWLHRREARIRDDPSFRLARDTFDIVHDIYRWGSQSQWSDLSQAFLKQSAMLLYSRIFPGAHVNYVFGRRLKVEDLISSVSNENLGVYTSTGSYASVNSITRAQTESQHSHHPSEQLRWTAHSHHHANSQLHTAATLTQRLGQQPIILPIGLNGENGYVVVPAVGQDVTTIVR